MTEIGIRALKQNASADVAKVLAGESVTVTDQGRPVAAIIALPASPFDLEQQPRDLVPLGENQFLRGR